jgi:hypothetical protein
MKVSGQSGNRMKFRSKSRRSHSKPSPFSQNPVPPLRTFSLMSKRKLSTKEEGENTRSHRGCECNNPNFICPPSEKEALLGMKRKFWEGGSTVVMVTPPKIYIYIYIYPKAHTERKRKWMHHSCHIRLIRLIASIV